MGSNSVANTKDVVLVTGFGPFGEHKINASWESVKLLPGTDIEKELGIQLVTVEIPVEYSYVQQNIPALWDVYKPQVDS
jgi:pyroglutamyl-peptidase